MIAGVEVMPSRNEARDREWGRWLNGHPDVKAMCEALPHASFRDYLGMLWADCWRIASLDAVRRNDQAGIVGLELARRLQEHIDLLTAGVVEREGESSSAYWRTGGDRVSGPIEHPSVDERGADPEDLEGLPF